MLQNNPKNNVNEFVQKDDSYVTVSAMSHILFRPWIKSFSFFQSLMVKQ